MIVGTPTRLNLIPSGIMPVIYLNQTDEGYDKQFLIYNGDQPYNAPEGISVTIRGKKGDLNGITENVTYTVGSNLMTAHITQQMTAVAGDSNIFELVIVDTAGLRIGTINMVFAVEPDALGNAVISESEIGYAETVLTELQSVQAVNNQVQQNKANIAKEVQDRISAVNTETQNRIAAVNAEASARQAADTTLQNNINAEANRAKAAENTLQQNISTEAQARATADSSLQSQINQIVAPSGSAPSAAEVENARIGYNGTVYSTLGDAIRWQITNLHGDIDTALVVKYATTPETISANAITQNIAFYAKASVVSDLPVSRNGYFLSMRIASTDYRLQIFYDFSGKKIWWRVKGNTWLAWNCVSDDQYYTDLLTSYMQTLSQHKEAVDSISTNSVFYATQSFNSGLPTAGNGMLRTTMQSNGFGLQEFYDYSEEAVSWRLKGENGWLAWHTEYFAKNGYYISGTQKIYLRYEQIEAPRLHQDVAAYNGTLFVCYNYDDNHRIRVIDLSDASYTDYTAYNGHGNGLVFGQTTANGSDYPLLYSSGWDDGKIYVLKFTGTAFQLVNTINLPVNGYTTCAVDDINHIAYIFYLDEYPTVNKPYTFIAWDYEHETELYRKLTEPFETMQGIDFHNGTITVASGYNEETSLKTFRTYDLFGNKTGEYIGHPSSGEWEPEGFTFDPITHRTFLAEVTRLFEIKNI